MRDEIDVKITADASDAVAELGQVDAAARDAADELDRLDSTKVTIDSDSIDRAARSLDNLDGASRRSGGGLSSTSGLLSDLGGPLGEAAGAASDAAGVFDGLGDAVGAAGAQLGLSERTVSSLKSAVTGLGLAVGGAILAWQQYKNMQAKAEEQQRRLIGIQDQLADKKYEQAASDLAEQFDGIYDAAENAGFSIEDVTNYLLGNRDAVAENFQAWADLQPGLELATSAMEKAGNQSEQTRARIDTLTDLLGGDTTVALDGAATASSGLATMLKDAAGVTFEPLDDGVRHLYDELVDAYTAASEFENKLKDIAIAMKTIPDKEVALKIKVDTSEISAARAALDGLGADTWVKSALDAWERING